MLKATELLNKFFQLLVLPELSKPDRIKSEWTYLLSLLKSDNIQLQRIQAYLNIIEKTQSKKRVEDLKDNSSTTISLHKIHRNSSNIEKQKEFASFTQIACPTKDVPRAPDDTGVAMQLLASINSMNKMLQSNTKVIGEQTVKMKGDQTTPKIVRNNFKKQQPFYDKAIVETKRYSSSFKNRY